MCVYIPPMCVHTRSCIHTLREADKNTENGF